MMGNLSAPAAGVGQGDVLYIVLHRRFTVGVSFSLAALRAGKMRLEPLGTFNQHRPPSRQIVAN